MEDNETNQSAARTIPFGSVPKDVVAWRGPKHIMYFDKGTGIITRSEVDCSEEGHTIFSGLSGKGFNTKKNYKTIKVNK